MRPIRVLVVEDSRFFQEILVNGINRDPGMEVVAVASDPYEARDAIIKYRPDVMTLDVELPRMNGIEFLKRLLPQYQMPVVMVSSLNSLVFEALAAGAVDFVNKPQGGSSPDTIMKFIAGELVGKIRIASTARVSRGTNVSGRANPVGANTAAGDNTANVGATGISTGLQGGKSLYGNTIIAIGASTGGTEAIAEVVSGFREDIPGVIIVQHMPPGFTAMYADRLNNQYAVEVAEAHNGDVVKPGKVLIANGAEHMRLTKVCGEYRVECKEGPKVSGHCPSVDVLFQSVAKVAGADAIGVILTGMGADGANGMLDMKLAGAETIGQSEKTCVVYGMPKVAYDIGAVKYQLDLNQVTPKIYQLLSSRRSK